MSCLIYQVGRFDQGITKEYNFEIEGKDIHKQLSSFVTFSQIYELFGLDTNKIFFETEVENINKRIANINVVEKNWRLPIREGERRSSPTKRNYFAHSGFEKYVTEIRRENNYLFVRYAEKYVDSNGNEKIVSELIKDFLIEQI